MRGGIMDDLDSMLDDIITREGGYVNNPADRGGATNYGITQATLSAFNGSPASVADVQALSVDQAKAIYRQNYYLKPGLDKLPALIQPVMLDAAVNSGPVQSIKFLQQVLNDSGFGPLTVDGAIGQKTIDAANAAASQLGAELNSRLVAKRRAFLMGLVSSRPSNAVFEKGWMARCDQLEQQYCQTATV